MNEINAELAIDRIEQKFERLRAGLAKAEAERDAARAEAQMLIGNVDFVTFSILHARLAAVKAERDAAREALGEIAAVTSQLGPDRASSQYMAEQAHGIASAFLANAKPGGGSE